MSEQSLGFFGALGSLVRQAKPGGASGRPWRKTVLGASESGLYATLASREHGALQVRLRPNADLALPPTIEVEWSRYNGHGPLSGPIPLYFGPVPKEARP